MHVATTFIRDPDNEYRSGYAYGRPDNATVRQVGEVGSLRHGCGRKTPGSRGGIVAAGRGRIVLIRDLLAGRVDGRAFVRDDQFAWQGTRALNGKDIPGHSGQDDDKDTQHEHIPAYGAATALLAQLLTPADLGR